MAGSIINEGVPDDNEPLSAINVTSLVDVMFCLLIMFMVATPLMAPKTADNIVLPAGRGEEISEHEFLYSYVVIDRESKVFLGTVALSPDPTKLAAELGGNIKYPELVFLQADENVPYGRIVDVLVGLKAAQVKAVGFVIDPSAGRLKEVRR